jgi:hypothetical protein
MKNKTKFLFTALMLTLAVVSFSPYTALAQTNVSVIEIGQNIYMNVGTFAYGNTPAEGPRSIELDLESTNLGTYDYSQAQSALSPDGASADCSLSEGCSVTIVSNIFYVTGSASGVGDSTYFSIGSGSVSLDVIFTVSEASAFTLQARTTYGPPYIVDPPPLTSYPPFTNYPQSYIQFNGVAFGETSSSPPTSPASGKVTGNLVQGGTYDFSAEVVPDAETIPDGSGYPATDSEVGSLEYALTVYPVSSGFVPPGINNCTNNPALGINYDGTNIIVSWPMLYSDYLLTSTTNLASTNWSVIPTPPAMVGNQWIVTNSTPVGTQFYRLLGP